MPLSPLVFFLRRLAFVPVAVAYLFLVRSCEMTQQLSVVGGGTDAYEFHAWFALHFHCDDCGAHLECEGLASDPHAPNLPWSLREG